MIIEASIIDLYCVSFCGFANLCMAEYKVSMFMMVSSFKGDEKLYVTCETIKLTSKYET